jgi:hypothetical protein
MSVLFQIILGSAVLIVAIFMHTGVMVWMTEKLQKSYGDIGTASTKESFIVHSGVIFLLILSHTVHLYMWAIALWALGALPGHEEPIYFALVTYTTVGYGDVTLTPEFRIFGAMASVNGILAIGMTTAFLVGLFPRIANTKTHKGRR